MLDAQTKSVAGRYTQLESHRHSFLERARDASELTIPTLVPPEGHSGSTLYKTPYQSVGARGTTDALTSPKHTILSVIH